MLHRSVESSVECGSPGLEKENQFQLTGLPAEIGQNWTFNCPRTSAGIDSFDRGRIQASNLARDFGSERAIRHGCVALGSRLPQRLS